MKTAEEKIEEIFTDWIAENQTLDQLERRLVQALREQDRDTRHACAEVILSTAVHTIGERELLNELHDKCMNAKGL